MIVPPWYWQQGTAESGKDVDPSPPKDVPLEIEEVSDPETIKKLLSRMFRKMDDLKISAMNLNDIGREIHERLDRPLKSVLAEKESEEKVAARQIRTLFEDVRLILKEQFCKQYLTNDAKRMMGNILRIPEPLETRPHILIQFIREIRFHIFRIQEFLEATLSEKTAKE